MKIIKFSLLFVCIFADTKHSQQVAQREKKRPGIFYNNIPGIYRDGCTSFSFDILRDLDVLDVNYLSKQSISNFLLLL